MLQAGTFLVPTRVGEVQHTSVTCSGSHLKTWWTSLLTLKPLAGRWESPSQEQKQEENGFSWPSGRSRWCLSPKHPILLGDHLCYCWHTARSRTSCCFPDETQISLASFPEPLHWLQSPVDGPEGASFSLSDCPPCKAGMRSYQTKTDLLRLRKGWRQGCSHSRHIFHPLVILHGELAGRGRRKDPLFCKKLLILHRKAVPLVEWVIQHFLLVS